jgi:hypothetical protein
MKNIDNSNMDSDTQARTDSANKQVRRKAMKQVQQQCDRSAADNVSSQSFMKRNTVRLKKLIFGCITLALLLSVSMTSLAAKIEVVSITNKSITAKVKLTETEVTLAKKLQNVQKAESKAEFNVLWFEVINVWTDDPAKWKKSNSERWIQGVGYTETKTAPALKLTTEDQFVTVERDKPHGVEGTKVQIKVFGMKPWVQGSANYCGGGVNEKSRVLGVCPNGYYCRFKHTLKDGIFTPITEESEGGQTSAVCQKDRVDRNKVGAAWLRYIVATLKRGTEWRKGAPKNVDGKPSTHVRYCALGDWIETVIGPWGTATKAEKDQADMKGRMLMDLLGESGIYVGPKEVRARDSARATLTTRGSAGIEEAVRAALVKTFDGELDLTYLDFRTGSKYNPELPRIADALYACATKSNGCSLTEVELYAHDALTEAARKELRVGVACRGLEHRPQMKPTDQPRTCGGLGGWSCTPKICQKGFTLQGDKCRPDFDCLVVEEKIQCASWWYASSSIGNRCGAAHNFSKGRGACGWVGDGVRSYGDVGY